ncbi:hypothetical protein EX895_003758 [Sporisorium graminicola]|uniref:Uncharacterized protein n=1 Tax=Sporisorium graminicola TaxID=280036 RepID=A0A4U7KRL2_9BASI|nr:hypothetical protein EX895_003758 [Sporisorium graminicola]TKY87081.1 hypothetical protein EX895_003758 [Sporisorium graminicola]
MTMTLPSVFGAPSLVQQTALRLDLDHPEHAIAQLKSIRNSVIGSRTKKSSLVHTGIIEQLVKLLRMDLDSSAYASDLVSLSATIIASLANTPAQSTLLQLLRSGTHDALLCCLRNLSQGLSRSNRHVLDLQNGDFDALRLLESILRALRPILLAVADQLSASPRWGIGSSFGTKAAASGVAIARVGSNAAASKIFGKSSRDPFSTSPAPIQDILMSSASHDNLRAKVKEQHVETEAERQRDLRRLCRLFLAQVYNPSNLPFLLGPLFMCPMPQQPGTVTPSASPRPSRTSVPTGSASTDAAYPRGTDPSHTQTSESTTLTGAARDIESLPMTVKTKILSVVEMICAILSATLFIPGCSTDEASDVSGSPAAQIAQRRERVLTFVASDSPFSVEFSASTASRGRSEAIPTARMAPALQAEVIRKGSRSRSRLKDADGGAKFDAPPLQAWDEDGSDELRAESDLAVSGPASVLTVLLAAAECGFAKAQEAALYCLAEITREEPDASLRLFRCTSSSGTLPTSVLLSLRQSSNANVRLAAFTCLANIIKVHPFTAKTNQCVLEVLMELLDYTPAGVSSTSPAVPASQLQGSSQVEIQIQAAFAIARLVADNVTLQTLATESYNALEKLAQLLDKACTRSQPPSGSKGERGNASTTILGSIAISTPRNDATVGIAPPATDESAIRLREACLTALAALTFQHDEPRRKLVDSVQPSVLAMVVSSIDFPALGVRVAACRLSRALSRSVLILRTSIVDASVAPKLVALLQDPHEEEVVKVEATAAICNLVLDFSPMKKLIQELGGVDSLIQLAHDGGRPKSAHVVDEETQYALQAAATMMSSTTSSTSKGQSSQSANMTLSGSQQLRLHAFWALKNLLSHSDTALKVDVMAKLDFGFLTTMCESPTCEMPFKEQALNILRNAAATKESDVSFVVDGMGGGERLMEILENCIWQGRDAGEPGAAVIEQAAFVLVNVATGTEQHRKLLLRTPNIMDALAFFCNHPWKEIRVAAARCIGNLLSRPKTSSTPAASAEAATQTGAASSVIASDAFPDLHSEAKARITRFGLDIKMQELAQSDVELDVRERARSALKKLGIEVKPAVS